MWNKSEAGDGHPLRTKFSHLTDGELLKLKYHLTPGESALLDELFIRLEKKIEEKRL